MRTRISLGTIAAAAFAMGTTIAFSQDRVLFTPIEADTLTVATVFPAPGVMEGDTPETLKGGVEWALAKEIAKELGLANVKFVNVNFAALISGQVTGYDIAAANIITLPKRTEVNDYTSCYYSPLNAALVREGISLESIEDAKTISWGVLTGSINESYMLNFIKPDADPRSYPSPVAMSAALQDGSIEGEYISLQRVAADAQGDGLKGAKIILLNPADAQSTGLCSAVQLPKGSQNMASVDAVVRKIVDEGKVEGWVDQFIVPLLSGLDPKQLPSIQF